MRITCPACTAKYSIADEKVQNRLAKIRCRKCGTTIVIDGKVSPPSVYAADGNAAASASYGGSAAPEASQPPVSTGAEYTVDFGDNDQRTMTMEQIVDAYNVGEVFAETYVWTDGMSDWAQLGQVAEIVDALHAAAGAAEEYDGSAGPAEGGPSSPWSEHPDAGVARAAVAGGHSQDLFGRYAVAGSEEEVTTSAPQDVAPPVAATGARNESSVLFSLSALTASASIAPVMAPPTTTIAQSNDDSGLIDLKALTAAAEKSSGEQPRMMSPLGIAAPLGVAAPLGMPAQPAPVVADIGPIQYPQKNRTGLYVGGGIAVAAIVIAIALVVRPQEPPPPVQTVDTSALVAPPPVVTTPTAAPELTAKPPPTTSTSDEADAGKPVKKPRWRRRPRTSSKTPSTTTSTGTKPSTQSGGSTRAAPKPKRTGGTCGCAPGDLMCNMKCSAGR